MLSTAADIGKQRMQRLAEDPQNVVYEYKYDERQEEDCDPEQTVKFARDIFIQRQKLDKMTDDEAGNEIIKDHTLYRFKLDHPIIFGQMIEKEDGPKHYRMLEKLARFKKDSLKKGLTQEEQMACLSKYILGQ